MSQTVLQSQPTRISTAEELGFDPGALREKYAAGRAKRLRADGNNQYQEITGQQAPGTPGTTFGLIPAYARVVRAKS